MIVLIVIFLVAFAIDPSSNTTRSIGIVLAAVPLAVAMSAILISRIEHAAEVMR